MDFKNIGHKINNSLHETVDTIKSKTEKIDVPDFKEIGEKAANHVKTAIQSQKVKKETAEIAIEKTEIEAVSCINAVKIIYFLMAYDGNICEEELSKFDNIGSALLPDFSEIKELIIKECNTVMESITDPEEHDEIIQETIRDILMTKYDKKTKYFISPKILIWDLLTVAYTDKDYNQPEKDLIKYISKKIGMDKAVFAEIESSLMTILDVEKEIEWLKTTDKSYSEIDNNIKELINRENIIFNSVKDLITL